MRWPEHGLLISEITVTLEAWSEPSTYTFSVDGSSLTMKENSGYGISGTFAKK